MVAAIVGKRRFFYVKQLSNHDVTKTKTVAKQATDVTTQTNKQIKMANDLKLSSRE